MADGKGESFAYLAPRCAQLTLGWASGSIEGRISVEYFDGDSSVQAQKYAFRAHRQTVEGVDQVYPINALAYHPM